MQRTVYSHHHHVDAVVGLLATSVGRFMERGYLHAAMAVCALAASAAGEVGFEERYAVDAALRHDPMLERHDAVHAIAILDDQLHALRRDPVGVRDALHQLVARAGRRPERAVALMRLAWNVITADDTVRRAELAEFELLCDLLGLDPEDLRAGLLGL